MTAALSDPVHRSPRRRLAAGFTLVELMIVVGIIGILAAVAYPAYTSSVIKGKRGEGRTALADLMQQQERYLTQTGCYGVQVASVCTVIASGAANLPFKTYSGNSLNSSAYWLSVTACAAAPSLRDCAQLNANPANGFVDAAAGSLWIRSTGEKGCTGTDQSVCWK